MTPLNSILFRLLRRTGYLVIANWRLEHFELSTHLQDIFIRKKIDCVFDIGANIGQYHDFLRNEVDYRGHIISFEPIQKLANHLLQCSQSDPLWHIYPFALGAEAGEAVINIMTSDDFSSFLEPNNAQTPEFSTANRIETTQTVSIRRIDDVMPEIRQNFNFKNLYLKIDTQGFDLEVIKGARNSLRDMAAIQCEVSVIPIYKGMPDYSTTITTLKELGFDLSGLFPVTRDEHLRIIEFDCISVNTTRAPN
ncbi:MAG TPA: FkbM family methyltransferase [Polaromonas sp.]|nr:FkbM family methyltransferase [Polaromonas sp.]